MNQVLDSSLTTNVAAARRTLRAVARRYVGRRAGAALLPVLAGAVLLTVLLTVRGRQGLAQWPVLVGGAGLALGWLGWRLGPLRRVRPATLAPRLDRQFTELEDSTGLLLCNPQDLNLLEQLQQQRVARHLAELRAANVLTLPVDFRGAAWAAGLLLLMSAVAWWWPTAQNPARPAGVAVHFPAAGTRPSAAGQAPPRIIETQLLVTPPAYTRLPAFAPAQASFQCPQQARVRWQVRVSGRGQQAPVLELGTQRLRLQPVPGRPGAFVVEQVMNTSALYRLRFAGTVSDDYAIDVRPDQAPVLRIGTPRAYTLVPANGQRPVVPIRATVRDDYGLSQAELVITVAQGQGETVKFREVRRDLSAGLGGQPSRATISSQLDLPQLGLSYGDELYFYLRARDNHGHSARTEAYLVQWQDTAAADSAPALGMGVKVAPAYFRSQRQIIIDTEKLIAATPRPDAATVASRANALGFDQQTLRLRYGKFMGEEAEAGIGVVALPGTTPHAPTAEDEDAPAAETPAHDAHDDHDAHDHGGPPVSPAKASATAETDALMDPYIHKHDDAETADFLEPAVKAKLRAVLDQMWAAELRLRTGQLRAALPYEYRALRLLKQVQQQTRAFVKKAGFTPPPMPEATLRLTGELAGAAVPHRRLLLPAPATQPTVRAALRWLATAEIRPVDAARPTNAGRSADAALLDRAGAVLAGAALARPGAYLPALRALREVGAAVRAGQATQAASRAIVARALTDLLPAPAPTPPAPPAPDRLARRYFQELSR